MDNNPLNKSSSPSIIPGVALRSGQAAPASVAGIQISSPTALDQLPLSHAFRRFLFFVAFLLLCFIKPVIELIRYALNNDLNSHIILIPFVIAYLIRLKRPEIPPFVRTAISPGTLFIVAGLATAAAAWMLLRSGTLPGNHLSATILSFILCVVGGGFLFFGTPVMRTLAFPAAFLIFLVPLPSSLTHWIEVFFQYTSAETANAFISLSGTPFIHDGLIFRLPGISIRVAEECSGIRSSLVLFITSLLAGHLFLVSPWKKTVFALAVIPLGIVRNGFRIFTIAMLCVHISPRMIDSPVHHKGGPIFFILSLIPFFVLLHYLRKSETKLSR